MAPVFASPDQFTGFYVNHLFMNSSVTRKSRSAIVLRNFRKLHRKIAIALFLFFFCIAVTGLLLGWKKNTGGLLLAPTQKGVSADIQTWLSFDSLHTMAIQVLRDSVSPELSTAIDRIDARPSKGVVKFVFADHYWGIQLDATTGALLQIERRNSDFIEDLHDGSLFDDLLGTGDEQIKLVYTTIMGSSLILLTITGFWLWYGPKLIRRSRRSHQE